MVLADEARHVTNIEVLAQQKRAPSSPGEGFHGTPAQGRRLGFLPELTLSAKGDVLWSMRLNAREHDPVCTLCEEEHDQPGGPARRRLMEPIPEQKPFAL